MVNSLPLDHAGMRGLASALMGLSRACIKLIDRGGMITEVSAAGRVVLELSDGEDITGAFWPDLWPQLSRGRVLEAIEAALAGDEDRFCAQCPTARGTLRLWDVAVSPLFDRDGWVVGMVAVSYDVTATAALEGAAGTRSEQRRVEPARMAAPQPRGLTLPPGDPSGLDTVGRHASSLAHDIRNVLGVAANYAYLIEQASDEAPVRDLARSLAVVARDGEALVGSLVHAARQESGAVGVVDAAEVIQASTPVLRAIAGPRVDLTTDLDDVAAHVIATRPALSAALMNLVANARDAMVSTGHVDVTLRCVDLPPTDGGGEPEPWVSVGVVDDGAGIEPARLARLQAGHLETSKPDGQGTGLGLGAVRGFMASVQGRMQLESVLGMGTRVDLLFPAACAFSPGVQVMDRRHGRAHLVVVGRGRRARFFATLFRCLGYAVTRRKSLAEDCAPEAVHRVAALWLLVDDGFANAPAHVARGMASGLVAAGTRVLALTAGDAGEQRAFAHIPASRPPERVARAVLEMLGRTVKRLELPDAPLLADRDTCAGGEPSWSDAGD